MKMFIKVALLLALWISTSCEKQEEPCGYYNGNQLYIGPKGGCFYYNSNGNKTYVDRSECKC